MKLEIYSYKDRYYFKLGSFSSLSDYFLTPNVDPSYQQFWKAYRDAKNLSQTHGLVKTAYEDLQKSVVSDASADEMIATHYTNMFDIIRQRAKGQHDEPENREASYIEIKNIVTELLKLKEELEDKEQVNELRGLVDKFKDIVQKNYKDLLLKDIKEAKEAAAMPPPAPGMPEGMPEGGMPEGMLEMPMEVTASTISDEHFLSKDVCDEMFDEYGSRACKVMAKHHPHCKFDINGSKITISDSAPLLTLIINDNLNLENIIPAKGVECPMKSSRFYQRYWKPLVEEIGHIYLSDQDAILAAKKTSLPDVDAGEKKKVKAWDLSASEEVELTINFNNRDSWTIGDRQSIKTASSKFTEEDILSNQPARVKCIDRNLESIFGKYGEVVQVIPNKKYAEYDVNFGRKIVRLTEDQFELSNEIPVET
tara:strand:+ start:6216 stop:7484 length:1269 start_codon:yes stop_codon:yes gene_type:complete